MGEAMINARQVAKLKKDLRVWNKWPVKDRRIGVDLNLHLL
jgi:hypothetical protein